GPEGDILFFPTIPRPPLTPAPCAGDCGIRRRVGGRVRRAVCGRRRGWRGGRDRGDDFSSRAARGSHPAPTPRDGLPSKRCTWYRVHWTPAGASRAVELSKCLLQLEKDDLCLPSQKSSKQPSAWILTNS